jgi:putative tryptophan/tyrosine transport system substrate-binding protein
MIRTFAAALVLLLLPSGATLLAAQDSGKVHRVAYLGNIPPAKSPALAPLWDVFIESLRERGYVEGRNLALETRFGEGKAERYEAHAEELAALRPALIVAVGSESVRAARAKTATIPILMLNVSHAVEPGFVASLARPGGNVTGIVNQLGDTEQKFLDLIKEAHPDAARVALLWSPANTGSTLSAKDVIRAAPRLEMSVASLPLDGPADLDGALAAMAQKRPDAIIAHPVPAVAMQLPRLVAFATEHRVPTITGQRSFVQAGLLMSYAPDTLAIFRRAADYVDRILKGGNPAEMPVEQPTRFELTINLKTARAIGIEIPSSLLARADEVIE